MIDPLPGKSSISIQADGGGLAAGGDIRDNQIKVGLDEKQTGRFIAEAQQPLVDQLGLYGAKLDETLTVIARQSSVEEPKEFSESLREYMGEVHRQIESLTQEQYRVIKQLARNPRVRVAGCAGSGKTLVAAEKAVRLAKEKCRTLVLCHSPLLAKHIAGLTRGTTVAVRSFGEWVRSKALALADTPTIHWTNYEEPEPAMLEAAFDALIKSEERYDAIIVDEGQDFRSEWWVLVEAALAMPKAGILYIFHDDHQALLPHRSAYPIAQPILDLSRNCRNAGRIFDLIRYFHQQAPEPELILQSKGYVWIEQVLIGQEIMGLKQVLKQLLQNRVTEGDTVVLLSGGLRAEAWSHMGSVIQVAMRGPWQWQSAILRYFEGVVSYYDQRGLDKPKNALKYVHEQIKRLSEDILPSPDDIELVRGIARSFSVSATVRRTILSYWGRSNNLRWRTINNELRLRRRDDGPMWAAEIVVYFEREDWDAGLPQSDASFNQIRVELVRGLRPAKKGELRVFDLSTFKGLEADTIILLMGGYRPTRIEEIYVGISRARFALALVDCGSTLDLPPELFGLAPGLQSGAL
jgi:hypothetical protein